MTTIEAHASIGFDETEGFGIVAFRDRKGALLDGSGGVDSMLEGLPHGGRKVKIPSQFSQLLALVAEHGGRWRPERGFLVRESAVPDLVRAMRALPSASSATEDDSVANLAIDSSPLRIAEHVELVADDTLERAI